MAEPLYINYTFEDIQRYLQGKMSAAEMHAMEKAALQDPFLADAIEGYNEASTVIAAQHLNEINASLSGRYETPKVVAFNPTRRWMRIAALIILLAGVGLTATYVLNRSNSKLNVAELKPDNAKKNAAPAQTDSQQAKAAETLKSEEPKIHDTQKKMKTADPEVERVLRARGAEPARRAPARPAAHGEDAPRRRPGHGRAVCRDEGADRRVPARRLQVARRGDRDRRAGTRGGDRLRGDQATDVSNDAE